MLSTSASSATNMLVNLTQIKLSEAATTSISSLSIKVGYSNSSLVPSCSTITPFKNSNAFITQNSMAMTLPACTAGIVASIPCLCNSDHVCPIGGTCNNADTSCVIPACNVNYKQNQTICSCGTSVCNPGQNCNSTTNSCS